jgi:hypothetical protein
MTNLGLSRASWLAVLFFAVLAPGLARAQAGCQGCADDTVPHPHILPALGLHVGTPQKASAALGIVLGEDWQQNGRDHSRNVALFVEPGISAGRASVAYVSHGFGAFGSGFAIGPSVLRTWKDPWTVKPNVTFIGGDFAIWPVLFTGPRIGVFRRASGFDPRRWFVSVDFGIGL